MGAEKSSGGIVAALGITVGPVKLTPDEVLRVQEGLKAADAGEGVSREVFREEMERLLNQ